MKKKLQRIGIGLLVAVLLFSGVAAAASVTKNISVIYRDIKLVIDGREFVPKDVNGNIVEPFIYNGTTFLPVRAVSQALGWPVTWDGDTSTVYIGICNEQIVWQADLNHDGIDDKIVVEIYVRDGADKGAIVTVYKGNSDTVLYTADAHVAHVGWDGLYLYHYDGHAYLMNWRPGMFQGDGDYVYEIFSFNDSGGRIILDSGSYMFNDQDLAVDHKGLDGFVSYIQKVNNYLMSSHLLADTDGGNLLYGTPDNPYANLYIPAWLFDPQ